MARKKEIIEAQEFKWKYAIWVLIFLLFIGFIFSAVASIFISGDFESVSGNVALIKVSGVILTEDGLGISLRSAASSTDIVEQIEKADSNPNIRAIIIEINSPGGSAVASSEIAEAIKRTNKTTVAWIRDIGTSGAYWVASAAGHVVANRASITGSIGVIASYLEFEGFLEGHNVSYRRLVSGEYKDIGSPFKEMTKEEEKIFQKNLDSLRDFFIEEVAKNRKMRKSEVDKIATGVFYIGEEAKNLGLVDELGGKYEVIKYIEEKEVMQADIVEFKKEVSLIDILTEAVGKQFFRIGEGIGSGFFNSGKFSSITA